MSDAETQYLAQYITNGVLDRTALADALLKSSIYGDQYGAADAGIVFFSHLCQNAFGHQPSAEQMATCFDLSNNGATLASIAVAIAEEASSKSADNGVTYLDNNETLVSPTLPWQQAEPDGPYGYDRSYTWTLDGQWVEFGDGSTVTLRANSCIVGVGYNVTMFDQGSNNEYDVYRTGAYLFSSGEGVFVETGGGVHLHGSNNQVVQAAGSNFTVSLGQGDHEVLFVLGSGANSDNLVYSTVTLEANVTNEEISGSNNNIILTSGDSLTVSSGENDNFTLHSGFGHDTIAGFVASGSTRDTITFDSSIFSSWAQVQAASTQSGANVIIREDANDVLTLSNVTLSALHAGNFAFA